MERLYSNPKTFVDNSEPDLDAQYFTGLELAVSAIDERVANLLINSLTSTVAGQKALDAVVGRILNEKIDKNAADIKTTNSNLISQKTLWTGVALLHAEQVCGLSQKVSEQKQGIVLKWQGYTNGVVNNAMIGYTFVPKQHVISTPGAGVMCTFAGGGFWIAMSKYVYIYDTKVTGNEANTQGGTASGVTFSNGAWVLTEVIGI